MNPISMISKPKHLTMVCSFIATYTDRQIARQIDVCVHAQSCPTLCDPMDCNSLSMEFSGLEYWSGLPFPSPGVPPDPGIEPIALMSPAMAGGFFTMSITWEDK